MILWVSFNQTLSRSSSNMSRSNYSHVPFSLRPDILHWDDICQQNSWWIKSDQGCEVPTHTLLHGGKLKITMRDDMKFIKTLGGFLLDGRQCDLIERARSSTGPMFYDLDFCTSMTNEEQDEIRHLVEQSSNLNSQTRNRFPSKEYVVKPQQVHVVDDDDEADIHLKEFPSIQSQLIQLVKSTMTTIRENCDLPSKVAQLTCVITCRAPVLKTFHKDTLAWNWGIHLIFPNVFVTMEQKTVIRTLSLQHMASIQGHSQLSDLSNWPFSAFTSMEDAVDSRVYQSGSLRHVFCAKLSLSGVLTDRFGCVVAPCVHCPAGFPQSGCKHCEEYHSRVRESCKVHFVEGVLGEAFEPQDLHAQLKSPFLCTSSWLRLSSFQDDLVLFHEHVTSKHAHDIYFWIQKCSIRSCGMEDTTFKAEKQHLLQGTASPPVGAFVSVSSTSNFIPSGVLIHHDYLQAFARCHELGACIAPKKELGQSFVRSGSQLRRLTWKDQHMDVLDKLSQLLLWLFPIYQGQESNFKVRSVMVTSSAHTDEAPVFQSGDLGILSTTSRYCPHAERSHDSNHIYSVVYPNKCVIRCSSESCPPGKDVPCKMFELTNILDSEAAHSCHRQLLSILFPSKRLFTELMDQNPETDTSPVNSVSPLVQAVMTTNFQTNRSLRSIQQVIFNTLTANTKKAKIAE